MSSSTPLQLAIWKELAGISLSVSHDRWHLDRVLKYASELQRIYGGDEDVLTAAVLMHDLGRSDPERKHGLESLEASAESADLVLESIAFPSEKKKAVLDAISEHDQPELRPRSMEARILKDADFLAGFGAWGLLRIAMWSGETGRNTSAVLQRLRKGMSRRMAHLEFPESVAIARREMYLIHVFLEQLGADARLLGSNSKGIYIVFEGVSGSGKDTQAQALAKMLEEMGRKSKVVNEPGEDYRGYREAFESTSGLRIKDVPDVKKWLMVASRRHIFDTEVRPELAEERAVIGVRSFISTLVYQCRSSQEVADTAYAHRDLPQPDLVILLDVDATEARARIDSRKKPEGDYESRAELEKYSEKYRRICQRYFPAQTKIINASGTAEEVAARVWTAVNETIRVGTQARLARAIS